MCNLFGGSPPQDNSAALARQQEQQREGNINTGKANIDSAFNVFDPAYFQKYTQAYKDNYNPQLDYQYGVAKTGVGYDNARRGVQDSTPGIKSFADLTNTYNDNRQQIAGQAVDATNKLRGNIDQQKSTLYTQNINAADPALASEEALSSAHSLGTPAQYSPLGNVFAGLASGTANYINGSSGALTPAQRAQFAPGATLPGGNGSGRVV